MKMKGKKTNMTLRYFSKRLKSGEKRKKTNSVFFDSVPIQLDELRRIV